MRLASAVPGQTSGLGVRIRWRYFAYFLGVPLVVSIYAALNNWEILQIAGLPATLLFYMAHAILPWWITCLSTTLSMRALFRWKPPWLALLLCGHLLGSMLALPYSNWVTGLYAQRWPDLELAGEFAPLFSTGFWLYLLRAGVIWLGINFLFDRFLGLPLYRYQIPRGFDAPASSSPPTDSSGQEAEHGWAGRSPAFVCRLPGSLQPADIISIKAEQHYIQITTPERQYMVLYRFSDAIQELGSDLGLQVHRSYWANTSSIESVHAKAKDFYLRMSNGDSVPVSGPYQGMVRELVRSQALKLHN